jgi:2-methylisocitrate lyase-like PEP mutase family enzyme
LKTRPTTRLRALVKRGKFLELPAAFDPLTARIIEAAGFKTIYNGGFVTGGMTAISEPLLTMTEQISVAANIANTVKIPVVMDAGAGWGEPLHTMRTVRECIRAGIAGVHIEDQLFPKRAHYHTYIAHNIPLAEYVDKIRLACKQRDQSDKDFVIIARSDACREQGFREAVKRVNAAAEVGADMGLIFPRTPAEAIKTPKACKIPMIYVQSRGTRDGRPLYSFQQLEDMGYAGCIDAILAICVHYHYMTRAMQELRKTGDYTGMTETQCIAARHGVETLIGLDDYYKIERATVEKSYAGMRKRKTTSSRHG